MLVLVSAHDREVRWLDRVVPCALGRSGARSDKREGDGATPAGRFPLRGVLFRADRIATPRTSLPVAPLDPDLGWCDDPADGAYNKPVRLPYAARHERLWRDDSLYDLITVIGYNDDPVEPGRGSAIFLHVAHPDFAPTEGCIAMRLADLSELLRACRPGDQIVVDTDGLTRL
jgi:L,D-peptidoglycan transpeptidase YkuD (ErfK/YbiS/YcfS/YnhG family)